MNSKTIAILAVLAVVVVGGAFLARRAATPVAPDSVALFPGLDPNAVTRVRISRAKAQTTLERRDGAWVVANRGGYPAKFENVKGLLTGLKAARLGEERTAKAERYPMIGVADPGPENTEATLVELFALDADAGKIILGKPGGPQGKERSRVFVRKPDHERAYLAQADEGTDVLAEADPVTWLSRDVVSVPAARIASVVVTHKDGKTVWGARQTKGDPNLEIKDVPAGRELKYAGVGNELASALGFVQLDDVRPAAEIDFAALAIATAEFRTFDGLVVTAESAKDAEGRVWVRLSARFETPEAPEAPAGQTPEQAKTAEEERAHALEAAKADVAKINSTAAGWAYDLGAYRTGNLTATIDTFLNPPPAPVAPETAPINRLPPPR